MKRATPALCLAALLGASAGLLGCGKPAVDAVPGASTAAPAAEAARVEQERGPVKLTIELTPKEPRLSDEPELVVTLEAAEAIDVKPPPFGDSIGGFVVRSFGEALPQLANGRRVIRQTYRLEPMDTGEHVIPAITLTFRDTRPEGDGKDHDLVTDPLTVTVTSLLAEAAPSLTDVRPPIAPVAIEIQHPLRLRLAAGVAVLVVLLGLLAWRLLGRRRSTAVEVHKTPSELAEIELRDLIAKDPLARGELQTFFVDLTLIVRRFIERTSGVRAPEQTTEEFLRAMRSAAAFDSDMRERLKAFLTSADLVKFARFSPARADIEESFRRAQEFVGLPGTLTLGDDRGAAA